MSESTNQEQGTRYGRQIRVVVFGDTADEMELSALDKARAFFGADVRLEVVRDYQANPRSAVEANGKTHSASIVVRTIEPTS